MSEAVDSYPLSVLALVHIVLEVIQQNTFLNVRTVDHRQILRRPAPGHVLDLGKPGRGERLVDKQLGDGAKARLADGRVHHDSGKDLSAAFQEFVKSRTRDLAGGI